VVGLVTVGSQGKPSDRWEAHPRWDHWPAWAFKNGEQLVGEGGGARQGRTREVERLFF